MNTGIIHIEVFDIMDEIKTAYNFDDKDWAKASYGERRYQSRISEIRKIAKSPSTDEKTGRAFSYDKCVKLFKGLQELIGVSALKKELLKRIDRLKKEGKKKEAMMCMILALGDHDEESTMMYLESVLRSAVSKDKK